MFVNKNLLFSFFAGAFGALAFAPVNFFPASLISFSIFYLLLEKIERKKEVFWLGFVFGFGHFLAGIYWISISLLVDAKHFAWLIPFALTLIPSALALYVALFALTYKFFITKFRLSETYKKIILFALCWLLFEVLRSNLFSGFPWNLLGYIWLFNENFAQLASVFGVYGLSLFAILISLFPTLFLQKKTPSCDKIFAAIIVIFLCGNLVFAHFYIDDAKIISDPKTKIRLVQANIKQDLKWDEQQKYNDFIRQIELTNSQGLENVKVVVWSETSVPYVVNDNPILRSHLSNAAPKDGILITGALRVEKEKAWNSIFVFNRSGIADHYDKHHLVPFGEFIPLQKFLSFLLLSEALDSLTGGGEGFSSGEGPHTLLGEGFSFSPLVCYEVIFSDEVVNRKHRPDIFINLTNDAWFGNSSGPYQHFNMARMRAIEYGIPLIRVANTGISALVDPFGRVVEKIGLNQSGVVDVDLIKNSETSIYATYRYLPLISLIAVMLIFLVFSVTGKKQKDEKLI
ncbi:MAG: apolipoprotein N-acyltransferase [Proteobacteria bacterium]|nr:apolipoprotein N-acyltransferase [Pseudomonadota bacterium]